MYLQRVHVPRKGPQGNTAHGRAARRYRNQLTPFYLSWSILVIFTFCGDELGRFLDAVPHACPLSRCQRQAAAVTAAVVSKPTDAEDCSRFSAQAALVAAAAAAAAVCFCRGLERGMVGGWERVL